MKFQTIELNPVGSTLNWPKALLRHVTGVEIEPPAGSIWFTRDTSILLHVYLDIDTNFYILNRLNYNFGSEG